MAKKQPFVPKVILQAGDGRIIKSAAELKIPPQKMTEISHIIARMIQSAEEYKRVNHICR